MWARWWPRWALRPSAPSIRSTQILALARAVWFPGACGRSLRRLFLADSRGTRRAGPPRLRRHRAGRLDRRSIPTSTACSPMDAAACSSAIRRWAASTSMTRPTPTSLRRSCIWARSAWSVREPVPQRWLCGPRSSCCLFQLAANLPAACRRAGPQRSNWITAFGATIVFSPSQLARRSSTSWSGRRRRRLRLTPRSWRAAIFSGCATRNLHLALVQLPQSWFELPQSAFSGNAEEYVTCLRSVLMKPEHEAWLGRIWETLTAACAEAEKG